MQLTCQSPRYDYTEGACAEHATLRGPEARLHPPRLRPGQVRVPSHCAPSLGVNLPVQVYEPPHKDIGQPQAFPAGLSTFTPSAVKTQPLYGVWHLQK